MWLYERINESKNWGQYKELPQYIKDNLNPSFELRPYQIEAFCNFITYYENPVLRAGKEIHTLFHMATGSGKTLIMAGLMLYLYKQGYRNFLFFVNLSQIVKKTEDNFLNASSPKYLFNSTINIDGQTVRIRKVTNFADCNKDDINILFDTTAGLHSDLFTVKENAVTIDDFLQDKTVLIADEAHHLNADTKKDSELSAEEVEDKHSWENTINTIFNSNSENIMLEFTATCDTNNSDIAQKYEDKIIYNYPLSLFKNDGFSKDIYSVQSSFNQDDNGRFKRCLQALLLSQYRQKVFNDNKIFAKPVVLLKSKTIKESKKFKEFFYKSLHNLKEKDIQKIRQNTDSNSLINNMFEYFDKHKLSNENLCNELKLAFSEEVSIDVNDEKEAVNNQLLVNSLEDVNNPYRIIFEVEKLDEGWDCLNLFDIVRLYETRDSRDGKPGKSTVREAQLIGRGARYYPFVLSDGSGLQHNSLSKYMRKFDNDVENPLRICEQLFYHCQNNSKYINELNNALRAIGLDPKQKVLRHNDLKKDFLKDDLYLNGVVFLNQQEERKCSSIKDIEEIKNIYSYSFASEYVSQSQMLNEAVVPENNIARRNQNTIVKKISQIIKEYGYNVILFNASKYSFFTFENIKRLFPGCKTMKEFFVSEKYLGNIDISVSFFEEKLEFKKLNIALESIFRQIAIELQTQKISTRGSKQFYPTPLSKIFSAKGTDRFYTKREDDGEGVAQKDCSPELQLDTEQEDWYVYKNNYGTTEEKKFVKYFKEVYYPKLAEKYSKICLIRNECQASIFAFNDGARFEPDYLLFLKNAETNEYEYTQVFIEPKGEGLIQKDEWKEKFLLDLKEKAEPVVYLKTDDKYEIWGLHFFCSEKNNNELLKDIDELCNNIE